MKKSEKTWNLVSNLPTEYPFEGLFRSYLGRLKIFSAIIAANLVLMSFGFLIVKAPSLVVWLAITLASVLVVLKIGGVRLTIVVLVLANLFLGIGFLALNAPSLILWLGIALIPLLVAIVSNRLNQVLVSFLFEAIG
jgi:hypothetical protein